LKDLALTEISFEGMSVEGQISQFAKLTASLRAEPTLRHKIRDKVNPHTVTLINVLNEFLEEAKKKLPNGCTQLLLCYILKSLNRLIQILHQALLPFLNPPRCLREGAKFPPLQGGLGGWYKM